MDFIIWVSNHYIWISLIGAIVALCVRWEKILPPWLHKTLLILSIFISVVVPLLGILKLELDAHWKSAMQKQTEQHTKEIAEIRDATKLRSYKERLLEVLAAIDPKIPPAIKAGTRNFGGNLNAWQRAEIVKIAGEPGSEKFILLRFGDTKVFADGVSGRVEFTITPELAK